MDKTYDSLLSGSFEMYNDRVVIIQPISATDYRYDFQGFRKSQLPDKRQKDEGDHLMLTWQGFRIDENQISPGQIQMLSEELEGNIKQGSLEQFEDRRGFIQMKFKSVLPPRFEFIPVPEFDMPHCYYVDKLNEMTQPAQTSAY